MILAACTAPNLIHTIGGAEKIGWSTHYHSMYFPVLVWASACGLIALRKKCRFRWANVFLCIYLATIAVYYITINPYSLEGLKPSIKNFDVTNSLYNYVLHINKEWYPHLKQLQKLIPKGVVVSAPEGLQTALYQGRTVHYYPIGLDNSDFVVLPYDSQDQNPETRFGGAITYLGAENQKRLNECLWKRLIRAGFDTEHPIYSPVGSFAVFKKMAAFDN